MGRKSLVVLERLLLVAGVALLALWIVARIDRSASSHAALNAFDADRQAAPSLPADVPPPDAEPVDFGLWSGKRVRAYRESLPLKSEPPLAVIRMEKLGVLAPVFDGTDDLTLNRGVGWIRGTAKPAGSGNIGIAGHRDGFFRALKDVATGDAIELSTVRQRRIFVVDQVLTVDPSDVSVLRDRDATSVTLVTCYPFYFIGDAPRRFIVHARLVAERPRAIRPQLDFALAPTGQFENKEQGK